MLLLLAIRWHLRAGITLDCKRNIYDLRSGLIPLPKTGPFDDIIGPYVEPFDDEGEPAWRVNLVWKTRKGWTKLATYYEEAEAQRQCDALSQALEMPIVDRAEAERNR